MISETKRKVLDLFHDGRNHYKLMEFKEAVECFDKALELDPEDGPSQVYLQRCRHYIENPPEPDWDGVFIMQTK